MIIQRIRSSSEVELYHYSHYALAAITPAAFVLSPSVFVVPFDLILGVIIPYHMHVGTVGILEDYVPRPHQSLSKVAMAVVTGLVVIGLLKVNLCGRGITESVKSLWRAPRIEIAKQSDQTKS